MGQNLTIALRKGDKNYHDRMEEIFDLFPDFQGFMSQKAGSLSGGQQQMLAVARALVNDNDLLLIDEPTEGLSPLLAKNVLQTLLTIKEKRKTVLLVEQNFAAAKSVSDFYYIFDDGKIAHNGKMEDLIDDHELISRYLGVNV